jgi:hypothetical protein
LDLQELLDQRVQLVLKVKQAHQEHEGQLAHPVQQGFQALQEVQARVVQLAKLAP